MITAAVSVAASGLNIGVLTAVVVSILVAIFASVTAPLILAHRTERMHREDQLEQYRREDEVAARAEKAARDLLEQQERVAAAAAVLARQIAHQAREAAEKLQRSADATARQTAEAAVKADGKLNQIQAQAKRIHTLVNSDMTAARQSELDQTRAMVAVLRRVIDVATASPSAEPDPRDVESLAAAEARATELETILADRLRQMRQVEAEAAAVATDGGVQPEDETPAEKQKPEEEL